LKTSNSHKIDYSIVNRIKKRFERAITSWPKRGLIQEIMFLLSGIAKRKDIAAIVNQALVSATNFFTGAIVARACTKETFGVYMLGFSIVLFLIGTQDSLILSPYTVYKPRLRGNDGARYAGSTLIHQFTFSALVTFVLGYPSCEVHLS
jgi:hypothetical protein